MHTEWEIYNTYRIANQYSPPQVNKYKFEYFGNIEDCVIYMLSLSIHKYLNTS